eukprot:gene35948-46682_t
MEKSALSVTASSIDADVVRKVANLAQLEISEDEINILLPRIQEFIGFAEIIKEINLESSSTIPLKGISDDVLRPDIQINFDNNDNIISNFPVEEDGYLYVPRVAADEP